MISCSGNTNNSRPSTTWCKMPDSWTTKMETHADRSRKCSIQPMSPAQTKHFATLSEQFLLLNKLVSFTLQLSLCSFTISKHKSGSLTIIEGKLTDKCGTLQCHNSAIDTGWRTPAGPQPTLGRAIGSTDWLSARATNNQHQPRAGDIMLRPFLGFGCTLLTLLLDLPIFGKRTSGTSLLAFLSIDARI